MIKKIFAVAFTAAVVVGSPALADVDAYNECMSHTTKEHIKRSLMGDLGGIIKNIRGRSECAAHLTDEEVTQIYNENKGWFSLFEPGGDLDPTRHGHMQKI